MNTACAVEEVRINTLPNRRIGAHFRHRAKLEQRLRLCTDHIKDGEVRKVDHADAVAQCEVLGVGDFPEVPVVPLGFTLGT